MATESRAWAGWVAFAGGLLLMLGTLNLVYGFFGLFEDEVLIASEGQLILVDLTAWAVLTLIFGAVQILTGVGLFMANAVARVVAIILAILHAVAQLTAFSAYPFWATLMIAMDIVLLFALTVRWPQAVAAFDEDTVLATPTPQPGYAPQSSATPPASSPAAPPTAPPAEPRATADAP
jgi:hypothetical protein